MSYTKIGDHDGVDALYDPAGSADLYYAFEEGADIIWVPNALIDKVAAHRKAEQTPESTNDPSLARVLASEVSFNVGLLRLAAVHGKTVTFRYAKGKGDYIETRSLVPESVAKVGDHLTFTGYDPDRDEPRAYRVDRMRGEVSIG